MTKSIRRTLFVLYVVFFRPILWAIIWLVGRTGVFKTVFLIYPTDPKEYAELCPNYRCFLKFLSGNPTPGGIIFDKMKPVGIYLFISNSPQELIKKKNRLLAETIVRRMRWIQKISGATACGFAGQLGPILEKRHGIEMKPPFFSSTMGNIFSIDDSISFLAKQMDKRPWQLSVAVLGGGELGGTLQDHFTSQGYKAELVDLVFKRRGRGVKIKDMDTAGRQLDSVDFVINLLPTGEDFLHCGATDFLTDSATVIDFSRPRIPQEMVRAKVFMGNRVQRKGMRFAFALPGWQQQELPACSIPSILASNYGIVEQNLAKFCAAARRATFETALAAPLQPVARSRFARLLLLGNEVMLNIRFYMFMARKTLNYSTTK